MESSDNSGSDKVSSDSSSEDYSDSDDNTGDYNALNLVTLPRDNCSKNIRDLMRILEKRITTWSRDDHRQETKLVKSFLIFRSKRWSHDLKKVNRSFAKKKKSDVASAARAVFLQQNQHYIQQHVHDIFFRTLRFPEIALVEYRRHFSGVNRILEPQVNQLINTSVQRSPEKNPTLAIPLDSQIVLTSSTTTTFVSLSQTSGEEYDESFPIPDWNLPQNRVCFNCKTVQPLHIPVVQCDCK